MYILGNLAITKNRGVCMEEKANTTSWNGNNIGSKSSIGDPDLIKETDRKKDTKIMKYEVGGDTISADDLQKGVDYDQL